MRILIALTLLAASAFAQTVGTMTTVSVLRKYKHICKSKDTYLGKTATLKQCEKLVKKNGGEFFVYGRADNKYKGECRVEHTTSRYCPEGMSWKSGYDFYQLMPDQPVTSEPTEFRGTMVNRDNLGPRWNKKEWKNHCCQGKFLGKNKDNCWKSPENNDGTCGGFVTWGWTYQCAVNKEGKCRYDQGYNCRKCTSEPTAAATTAVPTVATEEPTVATAEPTDVTAEPTVATAEPTEMTVYMSRGRYCVETLACTKHLDNLVAGGSQKVGKCAEQGYETYCSEGPDTGGSTRICGEEGVVTWFTNVKVQCDPSMETSKTLRYVDPQYPEVCQEVTITDCLYSYQNYIRDDWVEGSCAELGNNIVCPEETETTEKRCTRGGGGTKRVKMMITETTYVSEEGRFFCPSLSTTEKPVETTEKPVETTPDLGPITSVRHVISMPWGTFCQEVTDAEVCPAGIEELARGGTSHAYAAGTCVEAGVAVSCPAVSTTRVTQECSERKYTVVGYTETQELCDMIMGKMAREDEQSNALFLLLEDSDTGILVNVFAMIGCFALLYGAISAFRNRGKSYSPVAAQNTNEYGGL